MATAAASAGFLYEESVQAAAALESVRVAATAFLDMPGALAAGVSGAGAATVFAGRDVLSRHGEACCCRD